MGQNSRKEDTADKPDTTGFRSWFLIVSSVCLACFHLYTAFSGVFSPLIQRSIHLMGLLLICFTTCPMIPGERKSKAGMVDWFFMGGVIILGLILYRSFDPSNVLDRGILGPTRWEIYLGAVTVLMILEATRRAVGLPVVLVALAFLAYGMFGPYMPEFIAHKGYTVDRLVSYLFWTTEGVFGIPIAVSSTFVVIFILFGAFLNKLGAGDFFINIALSLSGTKRGGPALTSVIASGLMGSISGSSVSNVVTTGTFTIPLMIRTGFSPLFAGAVEAVASTGGQIMPL